MAYYLLHMTTASFFILLIIGSLALLIGTIPLSASAARKSGVEFAQYTYELVPGQSQSLRGVDSQIRCGDGTTVSGPLFDLSATRDTGLTSGSWTMLAAPGAASGDAGALEKAQIGVKQFRLKGVWDNFGRDKAIICSASVIPAEILIQGDCGIGVNIQLKSSNGVSGSFRGDVNCY